VVIGGTTAGVSGASGATVSVMVSPVVASDVVTGPGGAGSGGSATLTSLIVTVNAPIATTPATPAVADTTFNCLEFTSDHSLWSRLAQSCTVRVTEGGGGETFAPGGNSLKLKGPFNSSANRLGASKLQQRAAGRSISYPVRHARSEGTQPMTRFLARRLLNYVVLLAVASFLTFSLASLTFRPLDNLLQRNPRPPQAVIDAKAAELGLDKPIPLRYGHWVSGVMHGDFGTTIGGQPVSDELWRRIGVSLRLLVIGSVAGTIIGVVVGAWGAIRQYRLSDRVITVLSLLVISTPVFVVANLLILAALRVNSVLGVQLFEYTGETSPDAVGGAWNQFVDRVQHLVLPTFTLALGAIAGYSRYQRNAMLDVLGQDFIRTARAKGLTRRRALFKHGLRTALIPMATLFAYSVAGLFTGAVFTEKIFGWHGMGEWFVQGIATQDTNIVVAITLFSGVTILLAGLLSDVIYAALDPRVRVR
jgi:peptide/nickel transport system permease protein